MSLFKKKIEVNYEDGRKITELFFTLGEIEMMLILRFSEIKEKMDELRKKIYAFHNEVYLPKVGKSNKGR